MACNHPECRLHNQKTTEAPAMFGTFIAPMTDGTVHFQLTPLNPADQVEPYGTDPEGRAVEVNAGTLAYNLTPEQAIDLAQELAKVAHIGAHVRHHLDQAAAREAYSRAARN